MDKRSKEIILEAIDNPDDLTPFEFDFINRLADIDDELHTLSDKEQAIIDQIGNKIWSED